MCLHLHGQDCQVTWQREGTCGLAWGLWMQDACGVANVWRALPGEGGLGKCAGSAASEAGGFGVWEGITGAGQRRTPALGQLMVSKHGPPEACPPPPTPTDPGSHQPASWKVYPVRA